MPLTKEQISEYITALVTRANKPRNQIAALSGLSNTYIKQLENGSFISVRREKLISFGIALSLNLVEIDELLHFFDRTPLSKADIDTFLVLPKRKVKSTALLPLKDGFPLELSILGAEWLPGRLTVLNPEPTFCLYPDGFRQYSERLNAAAHPLYRELVEAINAERNKTFHDNLEKSRDNYYTQYICKDCLENYVRNCDDPQERKYRRAHIQIIINALKQYDNFEFFILGQCPALTFTMKETLSPEDSNRLFIVFWPRHLTRGKRSGRLSGFTTDNDVVIENFKQEVEALNDTVIDEYRDRNLLLEYLESLIAD